VLGLSTINPGIREVVRRLRDAGFDTTDSGDGVTNVAAGMEGALKVPHVHMFIRLTLDTKDAHFFNEACRLRDVVESWGVELGGLNPASVQAMYDPCDGIATVTLYGVTDADLRG
jgi:hypothetical protein